MSEGITTSKSASGLLEFWHYPATQKMGGVQQPQISVRTTKNDLWETTIYWDAGGEFWFVSEDYMSDFAPKMEFTKAETAMMFVEVLWTEGRLRGY